MFYVAVDDGEHHDSFYESNNIFDTLCEYHETMIDPKCQHYEWVEWGTFTEDSIDTKDYSKFVQLSEDTELSEEEMDEVCSDKMRY